MGNCRPILTSILRYSSSSDCQAARPKPRKGFAETLVRKQSGFYSAESLSHRCVRPKRNRKMIFSVLDYKRNTLKQSSSNADTGTDMRKYRHAYKYLYTHKKVRRGLSVVRITCLGWL